MEWFIYLLLLFPSRILLQESEVITIGAPTLHCDENGKVVQTLGNTTILQLPANSRALYSFKANNYLECNNLQRCTLMTWKVLREFEKYLTLNYADTKLGNVEFSNEMLLPGFNYSLHITLRTPLGKIVEKQLLLRYPTKNERQLNLTNQSLVDLSLEIGTNVVYSTMPLVVNAKVLMCSNIVSDYMFQWKIIPKAKEINEKGSELTLRNIAEYFVINAKYSLCCQVIDNESKDVLAEKTSDFTVKSPLKEYLEDFQIYLPFQKTTINVNSPITIPGYIQTAQRTNYSEFQIKWSCLVDSKDMCEGQQEITLDLESGFSKEGLYLITLKVSNNNMHTKTKNCTVEIVPDMPSISLDINYPTRQINAIEIRAVVDELRTYCTVEWLSEGQYALDLDSIPGFINKVYNISSKDETFLSNMEEFGHITVSKEFKLLIPPPTSDWAGLKNYTCNITLLSTCPLLSEINDLSTISEYPNEFFSISAWTVFEIEPPLKIEELDILFHERVALKSIFSYNVKLAEMNGPIFLQYGYRFSNIEVIFYSGLNVLRAETTLPYDQGKAIETFVTACDDLGKCGKKFGPSIFPERDTIIDIGEFEQKFIHKLTNEEYYNAVIYAIAYITSYSNNLNVTEKIQDIVMEKIVDKLRSYSSDMFNVTSDVILTDDASKFLKVLARYGSQLSMTQDVLDEIVNLRNQINMKKDENLHTGRILLQMQESPSLETIKASMEMSELIIIHSRNKENVNKEKEHLLKTVEYYMAEACTSNLFTRDVKIEMKTLVFSVQIWTSKLRKQFAVIPFENNSWNKTAKLNISLSEKLSNKICLGKILLVNYFDTNPTFGIKLFDRNQNEELDLDLNVTVVLPVESLDKNTSVKCTVYKNGWMKDCDTIKSNREYVKCFCPSTGYFFLEYPKFTDGKMYNISNKDNTSIWDDTDSHNNITTGFGSLGKYSEKISFVIIASCLVGFIILSYMIKKLLTFFPQHAPMDHHEDDVYYGNLLQDDALH